MYVRTPQRLLPPSQPRPPEKKSKQRMTCCHMGDMGSSQMGKMGRWRFFIYLLLFFFFGNPPDDLQPGPLPVREQPRDPLFGQEELAGLLPCGGVRAIRAKAQPDRRVRPTAVALRQETWGCVRRVRKHAQTDRRTNTLTECEALSGHQPQAPHL